MRIGPTQTGKYPKPLFSLDASKSGEENSGNYNFISTPLLYLKAEGFFRIDSGNYFEINDTLLDSSTILQDCDLTVVRPELKITHSDSYAPFTFEILFRYSGTVSSSSDTDRILIAGHPTNGFGINLTKPTDSIFLANSTTDFDIEQVRLEFEARGNGFYYSDEIIEPETWYHVIFTKDEYYSDGIKIYINGKLDKTLSYFPRLEGREFDITDTTTNFKIGDVSSNGLSGQDFEGDIAIFNVYNKVVEESDALSRTIAGLKRFEKKVTGYSMKMKHDASNSYEGILLEDNKVLSGTDGSYTLYAKILLNKFNSPVRYLCDIGINTNNINSRIYVGFLWESANNRYRIIGSMTNAYFHSISAKPGYPNGYNIYIYERSDNVWADLLFYHNNVTGEGGIYYNNTLLWEFQNRILPNGTLMKTNGQFRSLFRIFNGTGHLEAAMRKFATFSRVIDQNEYFNIINGTRPEDISNCSCSIDFNVVPGTTTLIDKSGNGVNGILNIGVGFLTEEFVIESNNINPSIYKDLDNPFIFKVNTEIQFSTTNNVFVTSGTSSFILPLDTNTNNSDYDFIVYWGDGLSNNITSATQQEVGHTYSTPGIYDIAIIGTMKGFGGSGTDGPKIIEILEWGNYPLGDSFLTYFFNLKKIPDVFPKLTDPIRADVFKGALSFNSNIFRDIENLTVSSFQSSINGGLDFNQPLNFNMTLPSGLASTGVSSNTEFNKPLDNWDVSNVNRFNQNFSGSISFNQDLTTWDVSNVTDFYYLFRSALSFNGDITNWQTTNATSFFSMFEGCYMFNQDISGWDVGSVSGFGAMFNQAYSFNQPIGNWTTTSLENLSSTFNGAKDFNQPLNNWDVSNVTTLFNTFQNSSYNHPLDQWDVSKVENFTQTFRDCPFDHSLGSWDIRSATNMSNMFLGSGMSVVNTDLTLIGWVNLLDSLVSPPTISLGVPIFSAGGEAEDAYDRLVGTYGWTLTTTTNSPTTTPPNSLVLGIDTTNTSTGSSNNDEFQIPLVSGEHNLAVHWGDTNIDYINIFSQTEKLHQYSISGTYSIYINGTLKGFDFNNSGDLLKITNISNWGNRFEINSNSMFEGCSNLDITATDVPIISTIDLSNTFKGCTALNSSNLDNWDIRGVTNLSRMFEGASAFNQSLNSWNVSCVTNMTSMFISAINFNQYLSSWDVSSVINMSRMFEGATNFNSDLSSWDISNVTDMTNFGIAASFSTANYDNMLIAWNNLPSPPQNIDFSINAKYTNAISGSAHTNLQNTHGWTIVDGGSI